MPTTSWELHFLWLSKPFWRCLGFYFDCSQHDFGQLICMDHLVSITWKQCHKVRGPWMARDMCTCIEPSCWCESTGRLFCMLNCGAWRASFSLTFFFFSLFFEKNICLKRFNFLIDLLLFQNAVLEFWISLVVCTQITAKRLSLLVTRKLRPDLLLNGLGKAQNMRER